MELKLSKKDSRDFLGRYNIEMQVIIALISKGKSIQDAKHISQTIFYISPCLYVIEKSNQSG